jgi:hypothetical protein
MEWDGEESRKNKWLSWVKFIFSFDEVAVGSVDEDDDDDVSVRENEIFSIVCDWYRLLMLYIFYA